MPNRAGADLPARAADIADGRADIVTLGATALANPDPVDRIRSGSPPNSPDPTTFYSGGATGHTDHPARAA